MKHSILMVGSLPPPATGPSVSFAALCNSLKSEGIVLDIVNLRKSKEMYKKSRAFSRMLQLINIYIVFLKLLPRKHCAMYILISSGKMGFWRDALFILAAKFAGKRIICHLKSGRYDTYHKRDSNLLKMFVRYIIQQTDTVVVLSPRFVRLFNFIDEKRTQIIPILNGLPSENTTSSQVSVHNKPEGIQFLYLSNLMETKGYWDVLRAASILVKDESLDPWHITLAGSPIPDGTEKDLSPDKITHNVKTFISKNNLQSHVTWNGPAYGESKSEILSRSDVYILPSKYAGEGQPVSIIEAIASGLALLSTDYRAIPDMLIPNNNGNFITYGEHCGLADRLKEMIRDKERLEAHKGASSEIYEKHFTWKHHFKKLSSVLLNKG